MNYTICGYLVRGPECDYLSAYSVDPVAELIRRLESVGGASRMFTTGTKGGNGNRFVTVVDYP